MPSTYQPRKDACSHCGDVVLIAEHTPRSGFGGLRGGGTKPRIALEHADPGPNGEVFDEVDEGCRRPRVAP